MPFERTGLDGRNDERVVCSVESLSLVLELMMLLPTPYVRRAYSHSEETHRLSNCERRIGRMGSPHMIRA